MSINQEVLVAYPYNPFGAIESYPRPEWYPIMPNFMRQPMGQAMTKIGCLLNNLSSGGIDRETALALITQTSPEEKITRIDYYALFGISTLETKIGARNIAIQWVANQSTKSPTVDLFTVTFESEKDPNTVCSRLITIAPDHTMEELAWRGVGSESKKVTYSNSPLASEKRQGRKGDFIILVKPDQIENFHQADAYYYDPVTGMVKINQPVGAPLIRPISEYRTNGQLTTTALFPPDLTLFYRSTNGVDSL